MVLTHTLSGGHMTGGVLDSASKTAHLAWWALLLRGLLSVAVGVFIFARPMDSVAAFALVIYAAMQERQMGMQWGWTAAFGVLSVAAGVFALIAPPITLAAIIGLIAGFALLAGEVKLMAAYKLRSLVRS